MAAYAAVAFLMNNIEQIMIHPCLSTSLDHQLTQPLLQKAGSLLDFIESYDHGGMMSEEAKHLERIIARVAHAAEDVIETHIVDQIHLGTADVSPSCSLRLQQATEDLDAISKKADELKEHGKLREDDELKEHGKSKIIELWVGEGFLRPASNRVLEEIAEGYLKELNDRNLIFVNKHSKNGKIKSCGIHDLVRDLSLKVGLKQEFFHVSTCETRGTERRIICRSSQDIREDNEPSLARSIFCWYYLRLGDHKLVRVCDGAAVELASKIYEKVNLRCIYCTYDFDARSTMKLLPSSISLIWNLQTLIIYTDIVAPIEIWKMRQLRHIKCHSIRLPDPLPSDGFLMMDNLQTLKIAYGLRLWEQVCKIIPNIKKLHLLLTTDNISGCYRYLGCLHKLQSLSLSLTWPRNPLELRDRLTLPISLNKLVIYRCALEPEDLWMIGSLPQLQVLELTEVVILNDKFSFIEGHFLRLKFLTLSGLDLRYLLNADSSCFPVLEKLFLDSLWYLREIPSSIGEIPTLELIHVEFCSHSATISAIRIKEDLLENQGNDTLQVHVRIHSSVLESFMELVESEGLTIDNIHLELYG